MKLRHINDLEAMELIYPGPDQILTESDMRPYQVWMSDTIRKKKGVFVAAEMGLGKTGSTLKAMVDMLDAGQVNHVLVVAPLRVAEHTWPDEIATWEFARHLRYRIVTGDAEERLNALRLPDRQVTIINRENLAWLFEQTGPRGWIYDMIVYDEPRIKSGRKRSKSRGLTDLGIIQRIRHRVKHIVELSGTPSPNGLIDLWGPIYAIDKGERLGHSREAFLSRWFHEDRYTRKITPREHAERQIMGAIKDIFFALREKDYLSLPPLIERDHVVHLSPREKALYDEMEREMCIEIVSSGDESEWIEAVNSGVLTGKLLQLANGHIYDETGEAHKIHQRKLEAMDSIVAEAMGRPILCAYSFRFDLEALKKRYSFARVFGEDPNDLRDWNAGKIKLLLVHPASAGHGLNFQKGSNIAVWYGLTWSLELYRQFIKRLHRSGQKADRVFLHRIIAEGTMDRRVLSNLTGRGVTQDRIMDAVRVWIKEKAA